MSGLPVQGRMTLASMPTPLRLPPCPCHGAADEHETDIRSAARRRAVPAMHTDAVVHTHIQRHTQRPSRGLGRGGARALALMAPRACVQSSSPPSLSSSSSSAMANLPRCITAACSAARRARAASSCPPASPRPAPARLSESMPAAGLPASRRPRPPPGPADGETGGACGPAAALRRNSRSFEATLPPPAPASCRSAGAGPAPNGWLAACPLEPARWPRAGCGGCAATLEALPSSSASLPLPLPPLPPLPLLLPLLLSAPCLSGGPLPPAG
jgi:hypothetical protein